MPYRDPRLRFTMGQPVRHESDPSKKLGVVVALILLAPYMAFVRWRSGNPTFEPFDDLIEVSSLRSLNGASQFSEECWTLCVTAASKSTPAYSAPRCETCRTELSIPDRTLRYSARHAAAARVPSS